MDPINSTTETWEVWNTISVLRLVFTVICSVVIIVLNFLIILAFVKFRHLRTETNCFMVSLAVAGMLIGSMTYPGHLLGEFEVFGHNELACVIVNSPTLALPIAALLSMIAVGLERYMAIHFPLRYPSLISRRRVFITIMGIWVYSTLIGVLPIIGVNNIRERAQMNMTLPACNFLRSTPGKYVGFVFWSTFAPGMTILLVLNAKVFCIARQQRRLITMNMPTLKLNSGPNSSQRKQGERSHRLVVFILLLFGHIFVIAHVPLLALFAVDYQCFTINVVINTTVPFGLYVLGVCVASLCPIVYPLVLAFGNREFRGPILRLIGKQVHRETPITTITNSLQD